MADFKPFKAIRYNAEKIKFNDVIAPPYDIISPEQQERLYQRSPYNCIRLILNRVEPADTDSNNRYTRANQCFTDWRQNQILIQEMQPSYYMYRQTFKNPATGEKQERCALLGRLKLEPFDRGIVIPHEKTLSKPREDRRRLLEATHTNFSPVFGLYEDPKGDVASLRHEIMKQQPVLDATGEDGVTHTVWAVTESQRIDRIHEGISQKKIYIADGHHRYQTALEHSQRVRANDIGPLSDYVLMALVEFQDPGLVILPTHRMILPYAGFDPAKAVTSLKPYFKVDPMPLDKIKRKVISEKPAFDPVRGMPSFGLVLQNETYWLTLQNLEAAKAKMPAGKAEVCYHLDVNVLGHLIFAQLWNLPESAWETSLRFTHHEEEAIKAVQHGKAVASFMLQAPHVEILREMGNASELMPQKSTYFYPKLESGLVFYSHLT